MEDIERYLGEKEAISACFDIEGNRCRLVIATRDGEHLKDIIDDWERVERRDSDLEYTFRYIPHLDREEQVSIVQERIQQDGYTSLIVSEEQEIAEICASGGAKQVYYRAHEDRFSFLIEGSITGTSFRRLRRYEGSLPHVYVNPPRARFGDEVETKKVRGKHYRPLRENGRKLLY